MPFHRLLRFWWLLITLAMACALPAGLASPPGEDQAGLGIPATSLALAQTRVAIEQTLQAMPVTPAPFALATPITPEPILTLTLVPTFAPSPTSVPTPTPVPQLLAQALGNLFCRTGPGFYYPAVEAIQRGSQVSVLAQDPQGEFWLIRSPKDAVCWVWGRWLQVPQEAAALPIATPPPPPPGAFAIGIRRADYCGSQPALVFLVVNRGPESLESIYIQVRDVQTGVQYGLARELGALGFPQCTTVEPFLLPGEEVEVWLMVNREMSGRLIEITARACTQEYYRGQCVDRTPFRQIVP